MKIKTSKGEFTPNDTCHLGTGGQASVYAFKGEAVKVFPDGKNMPPQTKLQELMNIKSDRVIRPLDFAYDAQTGKAVGYTMRLLPKSCDVFSLFLTAAHKKQLKMKDVDILMLLESLRENMNATHAGSCLVVDMNEMNVMVANLIEALLIDMDSAQTPSHPATAIMPNIWDPLVTRDARTQLLGWSHGSDYYAMAVNAFQLFTNMHPFKMGHPAYALGHWRKRMEDGVSAFDRDAVFSPNFVGLRVIPPRIQDWMKGIFSNKDRSAPPNFSCVVPTAAPAALQTIKASALFVVAQVQAYDSDIEYAVSGFGVHYVITEHNAWHGTVQLTGLARAPKEKVIAVASPVGPVTAVWDGREHGRITLYEHKNQFEQLQGCSGIFEREGMLYTLSSSGRFTRVEMMNTRKGLYAQVKTLDGVGNSAKLYDGVVIHHPLKRTTVILPMAPLEVWNGPIPELDGYRIVDAKAIWPALIVVAEKGGKFYRFRFGFSGRAYHHVMEDDIVFDGINMTVTAKGLCVLVTDGKMHIFKADNPSQGAVYDNPPMDSSMQMFSDARGNYFTSGKFVMSFRMS